MATSKSRNKSFESYLKKGIQSIQQPPTDNKDELLAMGFSNKLDTYIGDLGNNLLKCGLVQKDGNLTMPCVETHACIEISDYEYMTVLEEYGDTNPTHMIATQINGVWRYFVVGSYAYNFRTDIEPRLERSKYTRDYYTIMFYATLHAVFFGKIPTQINAMMLYPPKDRTAIDALKECVRGEHKFVVGHESFTVRVRYHNTVPEVSCSPFNLTIDPNGTELKDHALSNYKRVAVIDLGGGTLDISQLFESVPNWNVEPISESVGVNALATSFKKMFDKANAKMLADTNGGIPMQNVYEAFMTDNKSVYMGGGLEIDSLEIFERAVIPVLNRIQEVLKRVNWLTIDGVVVTGGGSALLEKEMLDMLPSQFKTKNRIHFPTQTKSMRLMANLFGAQRLVLGMMISSEEKYKKMKKASKNA